MTAIGIDLGGTKIETQVFEEDWSLRTRARGETPSTYDGLLDALGNQIDWALSQSEPTSPIGIGAAGLVHPTTGMVLSANLPANGHPLPSDLRKVLGRSLIYMNDCRALALSEAVFGQGRGHRTVLGLVLGTGVGGGVCVDGKLLPGSTQTGGEFGHTSAPAHVIEAHKLPVFECGCGRKGCIETYISGGGLARLARYLTGQDITPQQIADQRTGPMHDVWTVWCTLTADLLHTLTLSIDPDLIILGGGLSKIAGVVEDLSDAAGIAQLPGFDAAPLVLAEGGDASGARGAAYAAWQAATAGPA